MISIKIIKKENNSQWLVIYTIPATCGCYDERKFLLINSVEKPTVKKIHDEINSNKR